MVVRWGWGWGWGAFGKACVTGKRLRPRVASFIACTRSAVACAGGGDNQRTWLGWRAATREQARTRGNSARL